jgi:hypothetical protein
MLRRAQSLPPVTVTPAPAASETLVLPSESEGIVSVVPPTEASDGTFGMEPTSEPKKLIIVRPGYVGTLFHPIPRPLPERHRRRAYHRQRVFFVLLLVICLASAVPLTSAIGALERYPKGAAVGLANGSPIPLGPWSSVAGSGPLGIGGGAGPDVTAPGSAGLPVLSTSTPAATPSHQRAPTPTSQPPNGMISPAPQHPWPPNPWVFVRPGYRIAGPGNFYPQSFGQCTWWALRALALEGYSTRRMEGLGNARYWAVDAEESWRHLTVTATPMPNSTVVFQPGVQGAGGGGHVAHVLKVYPDGWFEISEMNFYWNGGGWGHVDYRYAHDGSGVLFILHP